MNQIPFLSLLGLILCGAGGMVLNVVFRPALKLAGLFLLFLAFERFKTPFSRLCRSISSPCGIS